MSVSSMTGALNATRSQLDAREQGGLTMLAIEHAVGLTGTYIGGLTTTGLYAVIFGDDGGDTTFGTC